MNYKGHLDTRHGYLRFTLPIKDFHFHFCKNLAYHHTVCSSTFYSHSRSYEPLFPQTESIAIHHFLFDPFAFFFNVLRSHFHSLALHLYRLRGTFFKSVASFLLNDINWISGWQPASWNRRQDHEREKHSRYLSFNSSAYI